MPLAWDGPEVPAYVLCAAAAALLLAGCTGGDEPPADRLDRRLEVPGDGFAEANLEMREGTTIVYDWNTTADRILRFDVHTHEDGEVRVHRETTGASGEGSYEAARDGAVSLLWENPDGEAAPLDVTVEGRFELVSFPTG